jgi:exonuclease VII small subunit
MNRSILILFCSFLLLSMLALVRFDVAEQEKETQVRPETLTEAPKQDVMDVLKGSLEHERLAREQLEERLRQTQASLETNQNALQVREQQLQQTEQKLARQEEEARHVATDLLAVQKKLEITRGDLTKTQQEYEANQKKKAELQRQYTSTQASLETLTRQMESTQSRLEEVQNRYKSSLQEIVTLQKQLESVQLEARVNEQLVGELERHLSERLGDASVPQQGGQQLDRRQKAEGGERQNLAGQLLAVAPERGATPEQLGVNRPDKEVVRQTNALIQGRAGGPAENLSAQADRPSKSAEVGQAAPAPLAVLFGQCTSNRIQSNIQTARSGLFGKTVEKNVTIPTVLFSDGKQVYTVYHLRDTPFEFSASGTEWERVSATLQHGMVSQALTKLGFLDRDPRILLAPVTDQQATQLQCKVFRVSQDLAKVNEAVLVGASENYAGECGFQMDTQIPGYLHLQRERLGRVLGKFVPSRGDLVFSKAGEIIGIMVNNEYCLVLDQLKTARTITLGNKVPKQLTAAYFSQMHFQMEDLPFRLR